MSATATATSRCPSVDGGAPAAKEIPLDRWRHDRQWLRRRPRRRPRRSPRGAGAAPGRQPRCDPRVRRAREQPQGPQHRDPEAPADGVHRRLRLGQELARVQHHRRGVATADQRDLQRLRAGLHADAGAARGRRARRADDRDHRRPGADGWRRPLHGRHRHRRQRDAAHPLQPARAAAHRIAQRVLLQRPVGPSERCDHRRTWRRQDPDQEGDLQPSGRHVPTVRGPGFSDRLRPVAALRRQPVAQRGRAHDPGLQHGRLVRADLQGLRLLRPGQADPQVHQEGAARPALQGADQDQGRRHQPDVRGSDPEDPEVDAVQGRRRAPAAHPRVRRAGGHVHHLPRVRRHAPQRGGSIFEDRRHEHRRRVRDADQRPRRVGGGSRRTVRRAAAGGAAPHPRLVRRDRARLPQPRPSVGHALGRRGAAHQDDPSPRVVAHRRHLRLRRADHRAAPPRHPADERPAAAAARQGQHRAGGRAQAGGDRDRRPRRRSRPRRRHRRWRGGVRGHRRRSARRRHDHRAAPGRPGRLEAVGANAVGSAGGARRHHPQPAGRRRRHPARRSGGGHRRRRVRERAP